jgi:metallo-beta-lactamase class B
VLTDQLSKANGEKRAELLMTKDTTFNVGQYAFETYYPGEGHTADNIVLWFPKQNILYGGCLIKGVDAEDLGFLGDGNKSAYEATLRNVQRKYPHPRFLIVTHSEGHDTRALAHSIQLAKQLKEKSDN